MQRTEEYQTQRQRREAPLHLIQWAPKDWLGSGLRMELALERDHLARLVYRELLDVLYDRGGYVSREDVPGACAVSPEESERALERLLRSGKIKTTAEGRLYNDRVLATIDEQRARSAELSRNGSKGAAEKWRRHRRAMAGPKPPSSLQDQYQDQPSPTPLGLGVETSGGESAERGGLRRAGSLLPAIPRPAPSTAEEMVAEASTRLGVRIVSTRELGRLLPELGWPNVGLAIDQARAEAREGRARDVARLFVHIVRRMAASSVDATGGAR